MSAVKKQIVALAQRGLAAVEIAEGLHMPVETVEAMLTLDSVVKREVEGAQLDKAIESMQDLALSTIRELISHSENDRERGLNARWVAEHGLGLKKPKAANVTINFNQVFDRIKEAKRVHAEVVGDATNEGNADTVDV